MQKAFEKIVERLEKQRNSIQGRIPLSFNEGQRLIYNYMLEECENSINVVNQVAEEYKSTEHINYSSDTSIASLDDVINRLQYKADNIKAKLEPSYFTECIDYLKSNVSEKLTSSTDLDIVASLPSLYPMMQDFEEEAILNVVASVNNDGWIPCSERLPSGKEYERCNGQFIVSDGNRTYAAYFDIYDTLKFGEPTISNFRVDWRVIAWQPLPQPYVKGE